MLYELVLIKDLKKGNQFHKMNDSDTVYTVVSDTFQNREEYLCIVETEGKELSSITAEISDESKKAKVLKLNYSESF